MRKVWIPWLIMAFGIVALGLTLSQSPLSGSRARSAASHSSGSADSPPNWAATYHHHAVGTRFGTVGFTFVSGGQILHGWAAELHAGPFGSLIVQGPTIRHAPNRYTRRSLFILGGCFGGVALLGLVLYIGNTRRSPTK